MPERRIATVLMLDVVGSTSVAAQLGDLRYRELASRFNRLVRASLKRFGGKEEDHAGDGFFATFSQPDRAIRCAADLAAHVRSLGIEIRSGIHTGQTEDQAGKTHGIAVVIGARVMSLADAGEILVTSTTKELVTGSGFGFEDFSAHELKGVPGTWQVFAVTSVDGEERGRPLPAPEAAKRLAAIEPGPGQGRPRRAALVAGGLAGLVTIAAVMFAVTRRDTTPPPQREPSGPAAGSVVQIDPETGKEIDRIAAASSAVTPPGVAVPVSTHPMVAGQGGVWVLRFRGYLFHVDPLRHEVRHRLRLEVSDNPSAVNLAEGFDAIWASFSDGLIRVHPATAEHEVVFRLTRQGVVSGLPTDVAVGGGRVWLGRADGQLVSLDPSSAREIASFAGPSPINAIDFGHDAVWTADALGGTVSKHDPATLRPQQVIPVPAGVDDIVVGDRGMWALWRPLGQLTYIDVEDGEATRAVQVGETPTAIVAGLGAIWVGDEDGIIRRVDQDTFAVTEVPFGAPVRALTFDDETDTLWVDVA